MKSIGLSFLLVAGSSVSVTGDAKIIGFDGSERAATSIGDLDTVIATAKTTLSAETWKAVLTPGTKATLRTEWTGVAFLRVIELVEGSAFIEGTWAVRAGDFLVRSLQNAGVEVSFKNGILYITTPDGKGVEIVGTSARVKLGGAATLNISYDPKTGTFNAKVLDGDPVDIKIGKTYFTADKGDEFNAQVDGDDFLVKVVTGEITVMGPSGGPKIVAPGADATRVSGGAVGSAAPRDVPRKRWRRQHRPFVWLPAQPFKDRTDVSPS